eukprot:gene16616-18306_t
MRPRKSIMKELHELLRDLTRLTDNQCKILQVNGEQGNDITKTVKFIIEIKPNDGLYQAGKFDFLFKVNHHYPRLPPKITCLTPVFHPNIDDEGEICLSLFEDWCPEYNTLFHCVHGLIFLLKNPNVEDPLNPLFCPEDAEFVDAFVENVRISLEGGSVEGFTFTRNVVTESKLDAKKDELREG